MHCPTQVSSGSPCEYAILVLPKEDCCKLSLRRSGQALSLMPHLRECRELASETLCQVGVTQPVTQHKTISPTFIFNGVLVRKILCPLTEDEKSPQEAGMTQDSKT